MNGIHDMGGMHGFGPVVREEDEPVFYETWEGRVYGMVYAGPPQIYPSAAFRYTIERMDPIQYLASSYYEHWLVVIETGIVESGLVTREELAARAAYYRDNPGAVVPRREEPAQVGPALARSHEPEVVERPGGATPRFKVDDRIRARNVHPIGHVRLPRYVRGRRGSIERLYGVHDLPDTSPDGSPNAPQAVYSVHFTAEELWGSSAEAHAEVYLDLWDSYLETDNELDVQ